MQPFRLLAAPLLGALAATLAAAQPAAPGVGATSIPFWTGMTDAPAFERALDARLAHARDSLARLVGAFTTGLSLNRDVYDTLSALDVCRADAETRYYVQHALRDFRLAGVGKDDATRKRIQPLRDELVVIGQEFNGNIRTDRRKVTATSAAELDGLPADFIARHTPDAGGAITLTIDYPDSLPVFSYAKNEALRKRMYMEYQNRAYPANIAVLDRMIARRAELAALLGFKDWADYITADKMVESAANAAAFIDRIVAASASRARNEHEALLKRKQQEVPGAAVVTAWESAYYSELVRKGSYDFDSQSVRPYFPFDRVKEGLLDVTSKLFGVTYRPLTGAPVWDPSVQAYEMLENGTLDGYSAIYYTYMWSLVIAKDLFSQFDRANLLAPTVARKYRDTILAPGGSKPAAALVRDFLGRPFDFTAWEAWLNQDPR